MAAVVFISPKQRQKTFLAGIAAGFLVFVALVSLWVFLAGPKEVSSGLVFNTPKVSIDLKILDSAEFQKLDSFGRMPLQFRYTAVNQKKQSVSGFVSAVSREEALEKLVAMGLEVGSIEETEVGRSNPFEPYYSAKATQ